MAAAYKMCRLCMGRSNLNHTVLEEQFLQKIAICVSLLINPEDKSLPLDMCVLCALKVKDFYEFRQNCLEVQRLLEQNRSTVEEQPEQVPEVVHKQEPLPEPDVQEGDDDPEAEPTAAAVSQEPDIVEEHFDEQVGDSLVDVEEVAQDQITLEVPEGVELDEEPKYEIIESDYELIANEQMESFHDGEEDEEEEEEAVIEYLSYDESTQDHSELGDIPVDIKPVSVVVVHREKRKQTISRKDRDEKEIYRSLLLECEICGKSVERNRMEGHRNRHEGLRPYKCPALDCGTEFHCKISLRLHYNNRHSTDEFACDLCSKVYNSRKTLYHHKRETHAEKQFKCDQCGLQFVSNARLNRHKITHTDLREFKCPHCPKEFHRSNNLKVHLRSHTKEKPFECSLCDKAFGYQRLLRSHVERKHADA
ncbi:zinc finger protein 14 [Culex quinquefasciatus]|uniref:zinc finger protein 14 n=1 Tax=Culex quinquefasciatus TaxID=7176 RepID=UPI0018E39A61|nr:zinc finger protein 14 [Culex quinquefasciatus]